MIRQAPWSIGTAVVVLTIIAGGLIYAGFKETLSRKNDLIETLEGQLKATKNPASPAAAPAPASVQESTPKPSDKHGERAERKISAKTPATTTVITIGPQSPVTTGPNSPITLNPDVNQNRPTRSYFCNGASRTIGPDAGAAFMVRVESDDTVFKKMIELNNSRQYDKLLAICAAEIESKPDWLTPYLFCGLGYLAASDTTKATEMLKHFDAKTGPLYGQGACKEISEFLRSSLPAQ